MRDDAEELYMRRASEANAHAMLDQAGVPHGELSLNGRLAKALGLRYASAGPSTEADRRPTKGAKTQASKEQPAKEPAKEPAKGRERKVDEVRAMLLELPEGDWPVASSGLSLDVGDARVRFEGGSRELRLLLARWFSMSRAVAELFVGRTKR